MGKLAWTKSEREKKKTWKYLLAVQKSDRHRQSNERQQRSRWLHWLTVCVLINVCCANNNSYIEVTSSIIICFQTLRFNWDVFAYSIVVLMLLDKSQVVFHNQFSHNSMKIISIKLKWHCFYLGLMVFPMYFIDRSGRSMGFKRDANKYSSAYN